MKESYYKGHRCIRGKLSKKFDIGVCPPLSPIGISTISSNPHSKSNNTAFISKSMTSETPAAVNLTASETSETLAADIVLAVPSS